MNFKVFAIRNAYISGWRKEFPWKKDRSRLLTRPSRPSYLSMAKDWRESWREWARSVERNTRTWIRSPVEYRGPWPGYRTRVHRISFLLVISRHLIPLPFSVHSLALLSPGFWGRRFLRGFLSSRGGNKDSANCPNGRKDPFGPWNNLLMILRWFLFFIITSKKRRYFYENLFLCESTKISILGELIEKERIFTRTEF